LDLGKNLPSRARRKLVKGDVIISSIEGSLDSCAIITEEYDGALCSTGFFVINSNEINPETLLVLSKSIIMQNLFKQGCKGTILTAISEDELGKIPIPLIDHKSQLEISKRIKESYALRKESGILLENAKRLVEEEIDKK
jgi:restriction endonuclease S subunit